MIIILALTTTKLALIQATSSQVTLLLIAILFYR